MTFKELLRSLRACDEARDWAGDMPIEEVVDKCDRGDWLLWLARKGDVPIRPLTLAKGRCAELVKPYMKDERSIKAVEAAIAFGRGEIDEEELKLAAYAAYAAYDYAAAAAYAAADAAADYAAADAAAAYDAYAYADDARKETLSKCADICRDTIGELIIERVNELLTKTEEG